MTTQTAPDKLISYDRESRDYAMYLDGELVGFARTYHEAEVTLDQLVYESLLHSAADPDEDYPGQDDGCPPDCPDGCGEHGYDEEPIAAAESSILAHIVHDGLMSCDLCGEPGMFDVVSDGMLCDRHLIEVMQLENEINADAPVTFAPITCGACGGQHHVQRCPDIRKALAAPDHEPKTCHCGSRGQGVLINHEYIQTHACPAFDGSYVVHFRGQLLDMLWPTHEAALQAMERFIPAQVAA